MSLHDASALKISVVTAVYNRRSTIAETIESVLRQSWPNKEIILVDGMSNDGTDEVINHYRDKIHISIREPDKGIYDALNKGINAATGDVIGFLHADDVFASDKSLESIGTALASSEFDACYGDLLYVRQDNIDQIIRYWSSGAFNRDSFFTGWMPPHPTFYLKSNFYKQFGGYRDDFRISADYELMLRMLVKHKLRATHINRVIVKMRVGGKSNVSISNRLLANQEDNLAWQANDFKAPLGLRFTKPLRKLTQFFRVLNTKMVFE